MAVPALRRFDNIMIMQDMTAAAALYKTIDGDFELDKAKKKYGNLCDSSISEVLVVMLERSPGSGLGLSLSGHKDRTKMAVMVCGLNPNGPAAKSGCLRVGDEILEVMQFHRIMGLGGFSIDALKFKLSCCKSAVL